MPRISKIYPDALRGDDFRVYEVRAILESRSTISTAGSILDGHSRRFPAGGETSAGKNSNDRGSELKTHPKARGGCDAGTSIDFESNRRGDPSNLQLDSLSPAEEGETTLKRPLAARLRGGVYLSREFIRFH